MERMCSMRYSRQNKILDIINTHEVETQERLAALLRKSFVFSRAQARCGHTVQAVLQLQRTLNRLTRRYVS